MINQQNSFWSTSVFFLFFFRYVQKCQVFNSNGQMATSFNIKPLKHNLSDSLKTTNKNNLKSTSTTLLSQQMLSTTMVHEATRWRDTRQHWFEYALKTMLILAISHYVSHGIFETLLARMQKLHSRTRGVVKIEHWTLQTYIYNLTFNKLW